MLDKLKYSITKLITEKEKKLIYLKQSYILQKPYQLLDKKSNRYLQLLSKLETLSPLQTLQRGYTMAKINGKVVESCKKIKKEDVLVVTFRDGEVITKVI